MSCDYFSEMLVKFAFAKQCCNHFLTLLFLLCLFNYRHILASFVWSSTPTRTYPSTRRTSLRCTGGRRGTRCLHTSTPSLSQRTAACSKVWQTTSPRLTLCFPCRGFSESKPEEFLWVIKLWCEHVSHVTIQGLDYIRQLHLQTVASAVMFSPLIQSHKCYLDPHTKIMTIDLVMMEFISFLLWAYLIVWEEEEKKSWLNMSLIFLSICFHQWKTFVLKILQSKKNKLANLVKIAVCSFNSDLAQWRPARGFAA